MVSMWARNVKELSTFGGSSLVDSPDRAGTKADGEKDRDQQIDNLGRGHRIRSEMEQPSAATNDPRTNHNLRFSLSQFRALQYCGHLESEFEIENPAGATPSPHRV